MRTRGGKSDGGDYSRVRPPTQSNRRAAVEKRRKRNEERQAPQDEQPQDEQAQQNLMFDAEQDEQPHDEQPQHDHEFYDEYDQQQQHFDDEHGQQHQPDEPMFPGGPYDLSVLTDYEHHIAINVWNGQERRALKVVSNGKKQDKFIDIRYHLPAQIDHWINISGLRPLRRCSLHMIDGNMISAFAERWHAETSSFHLPFGEMTITLDDVRGLLSIPCTGEFFTPPANVNEDLAIAAAVELLGVTYDEAVFYKKLYEGRYDCAAKAYLLHLVGCTILADKSFTLVSAKYLFLFQDLDSCGKWAWGPAALVVLYDYLRDSTFLQPNRLEDICLYFRAKLDALRDTDIILAPDYDQNALPERCIRQFGYTQHIPPTPPMLVARDVDVEWSMYRNSVRSLRARLHPAAYPHECVEGYIQWYYRISHPRMIPYVAAYAGPSYDADAGPSHDADQSLDLHMGGPEDEMRVLLERALYISRGGDYQ
ncbi:uncharacterized protein [Cicer arietinum]|uniref:uncharacterized protein n=1 Tax=Cicer arietinum TaxID=3827 RepID=UPI003CC59590